MPVVPQARVAFVRSGSLALFVAITSIASAASGLVVLTQNGAVQGINVGNVNEWRGIPYAAAPSGSLRWRAPISPAPWTGVRDATQFGSPCAQPDFQGGIIGNEDCLFLNVFAPVASSTNSKLPVMVHLHGGSNFFGQAYQDARVFVDRGVIVVTLNYRLGVFGFMAHPALTVEGGGSSSNYGLMDQIAALEWVQANIANFGGDPSNVTLFGFSAGAFDASALMLSPVASGLFVRVATQPPTYWAALNGVGLHLQDIELLGEQLAQSVGCGNSIDVLACLRSIPADVLVTAFGDTEIDPVIDGRLLPQSIINLMNETGGTVPLLTGSGREERGFDIDSIPNPMHWDQYVLISNDLVGEQDGQVARALFPPSDYESIGWAFLHLETDAIYTCPTRQLALRNHPPTYRFLSTHTMENDPVLAETQASHITEDILLWGATGIWSFYIETPAEQALSDHMQQYWTNFAKTGDPNGAALPVWPLYEPQNRALLLFDDVITATNGDYHTAQCDFLDTVQLGTKCGALCRAHVFPTAQQ